MIILASTSMCFYLVDQFFSYPDTTTLLYLSGFSTNFVVGDFERFIIATLENAGSQGIPFVTEAYQNYINLGILKELDQRCHVCLSNHVANRASKRQVSDYFQIGMSFSTSKHI